MHKWVAFPTSGVAFHTGIRTPLGRITWAGRHMDLHVDTPMATRRWGTYAAVYVARGHARFHNAAGVDVMVGAGDLLLMFPRLGYRYVIDPTEPWSEFFIQFQGPLFGLWVKEGLLSPRQPIAHLEPVDYWWSRLEAIVKPLALPEPAQSLKRVCLLQEFLVDGVVTPQAAAGPAAQRWLATARALLAEDLGRPANWEAMARRLGLSYHGFRKKFAALAGVSPAHYRASNVIAYAGELLQNKRLSPRDIANRCGFCDEFHLTKRFKQLTGLTPAQFRKNLM